MGANLHPNYHRPASSLHRPVNLPSQWVSPSFPSLLSSLCVLPASLLLMLSRKKPELLPQPPTLPSRSLPLSQTLRFLVSSSSMATRPKLFLTSPTASPTQLPPPSSADSCRHCSHCLSMLLPAQL